MLNWIWGCGNGAYLALLCLVPILNIVWVFVCGAKGNEWAWKSGKFKDLDTFLTTQRTWNIAGIILFVILIAYIAICIIFIALGISLFSQGWWGDAINGRTWYGDYRYDWNS
jgi:Trk-type K+ transport system membrane component